MQRRYLVVGLGIGAILMVAGCGGADDSIPVPALTPIAPSTPIPEQDATATQVLELTASESGDPSEPPGPFR